MEFSLSPHTVAGNCALAAVDDGLRRRAGGRELAVRKRFTHLRNLQTPVTIYVNIRVSQRWSYANVACAYVRGEGERIGHSLINIERGRDNFN